LVDDVIYVFGGIGADGKELGDLHSFKLPSNIFRSRCQSCVDHCLQITGGINSLIWVHCQAGDQGTPWLQRTPGCLFWVERPPHLQTQKITGSSTYWILVRILLHTPGTKSHSPLVTELIKYPDASKTRNTVRKFPITPLNVSTSSPQNNSGINDERSKSPNARPGYYPASPSSDTGASGLDENFGHGSPAPAVHITSRKTTSFFGHTLQPTCAPTEVLAASQEPTQGATYIITRVRALHTFQPTDSGDLGFEMGDVIEVVDQRHKDWWRGQLNGCTGIFPVNYVVSIV
jgi:Variant SH3 domain/Galactose oxidase, central domain